jgi:hypothetical protein
MKPQRGNRESNPSHKFQVITRACAARLSGEIVVGCGSRENCIRTIRTRNQSEEGIAQAARAGLRLAGGGRSSRREDVTERTGERIARAHSG